MASLGSLSVTVGASIDGFEKSMGTVSQRLNAIDRDATKAFSGFDKLGGRLESIGTSLSAAITLPLVGISAAAVKVAGDFEGSFNKVSALGDITGASLDKLKAQAIRLGAETAFSAQQAADGMAVFASAGFNAEKIYAAMPGTLSLAAAGQITIAESATLVKDALGQFGLAASDTQRIADVLAQASLDTSAKMGELGATLTYVGPIAHGAGQSLEETVAAIIALDAAGIRGEKAGTGLRGVLGSLLAPSKEAAGYLNDLGVSVSDASGKVLPLSAIMEDFKQKLGAVGSEAERSNIIFQVFGREAGNAAQILIGTGGPALDAFEQKLLNNGNAADRVAKQLNQGFSYQMDQLKGSVETAGIVLGNALLPAVNLVLSAFTSFVNNAILPVVSGFNALPDSVKLGAIAIAGLAAATGPVIFVIGQLVSSVASIGAAATSMASILAKQPALLATITSSLGYATVAAGLFAGAILFGVQFRQLSAELSTAAEKIELNTGAWARLKEVFSGTDTTKVAADIKYAGQACRESAADVLEMELAWKNFQDRFTFAALLEAITGPLGALTASVRGLGDTFEEFGGKYVSMEKAAADSATRLQKSVGDAMKAQLDAAMADIDSQKKRVAESERLTKGTDAYRAAVEKEKEALKKSTAEKKIHEQAMLELGLSVDKADMKTRNWLDTQPVLAAQLRLVDAEYKKNVEGLAALKLAFERGQVGTLDMSAGVTKLALDIGNLTGSVSALPQMPGFTGMIAELDAIGAAYQRLGITSTGELKRIADQHLADFNTIKNSGTATAQVLEDAWLKWLGSAATAARQAGEDIPIEVEGILAASNEKTKTKIEEQKTLWDGFGTSVSTVITNFAQDISKSLWDGDMSWGQKGKELLKSLGESVTSLFVEPATKAIGDFVKGAIKDLLSGDGLGGVAGMLKDIGGGIASLFGGGGGIVGAGADAAADAASAVSGIVGAGGSAAGSAGNAAAGIAGQAAGMGFSAISGIITGAASAISGIIGNFQNAKQETTLNAIEHEVRYSQIHLLAILETGVNVFMAELPSIRGLTQQFLDQHAWRIHDVWSVLTEIRDAAMIPSLVDPLLAGGGGNITVVVNLDGNEVGRALVNRSELAGGAIP